MWMMTTLGFFSAVCARTGDGRHSNPVDRDRIMVRARVRGHLDNLKAAFPEELAGVEVLETKSTDYPCRMFLPKATWATIVSRLVEATDYDNFKDAAATQGKRTADPASSSYVHALHEVWSAMRRIEAKR